MARSYKNYADFIKRELHAVPVYLADPQRCLTAVLELKKNKVLGSREFQLAGHLSGLCAESKHKEDIQKKLKNVITLEDPFDKAIHYQSYSGCLNTKNSGMLGLAFPNNASSIGAWFSSSSKVIVKVDGITIHFLKTDYITDIIYNLKWTPSHKNFKDIYVVTDVILASKVIVQQVKEAKGGGGAKLDISSLNATAGPTSTLDVGLDFTELDEGSFEYTGVNKHGEPEPFPIAFRCAHIVYKNDFTGLKKTMPLGVRRGEHDGLYISGFVAKDEKYHIGEFFLNAAEDDDEDSDDEISGPEVVPVIFDQAESSEPAAHV